MASIRRLSQIISESLLYLTDVTTGNATTQRHGLLRKLSGSTSDVLLGDGTFGALSGGEIATQAEVATGTNDTKMVTPLAAQALGGADGWTPGTGTWTYNAPDKINVPSGAASIYQKGDRIKWTQTTVRYGVIAAVADTLLTIAVNTDYTVTDAAISANYYSHQANPLGYPHNFTYAGSWISSGTAPSLGNGTLQTKMAVTGKRATIKGELFMGSTSTYGTGVYFITLPGNLAPVNSRQDIGGAWYLTGGTPRVGLAIFNYNSTAGVEFLTVSNASVNPTSPATWANGDRLNFNLDFEF